jgi:serpin B
MHNTGRFGYAETDRAQILSLSYKGGELEMVLVLPADGTPLSELESNLDASSFANWLAAPAPTTVTVAMPRLHLETEFDLTATLRAMGLREVFTPDADLTGMAPDGNLMIDRVVHKAYLDVDEKGTEAAAATGVALVASSAPPVEEKILFIADRPFMLAIRHRETGAVLFLGRVADPG